jgi:hypothetical protein
VAAISGIGMSAFDLVADELLDRRNDPGERTFRYGEAYLARVQSRHSATATLDSSGAASGINRDYFVRVDSYAF